MKLKTALGALLALSVALGVSSPASSQEKVVVAVSSQSLAGGGARFVKELGLFAKHGIDATVTAMDNAAVATAALISDSVQFAAVGGAEPLMAQARGQDLVAMTMLYVTVSGVLVLDKDVAAKLDVSPTAPLQERLKALDGVLLASTGPQSYLTNVLRPAIKAAGADARFTFMPQTSMIAAMESGAIEGFVAASPFWALPAANGSGVVWVNGPVGELSDILAGSANTLMTTRAYADANPKVVQGMAAAFADFSKMMVESPDEVKAAMARLFPTIEPALLDRIFEIESKAMQPRPMTREDMEREIAYMKASGVEIPNIDSLDPDKMLLK